MRALAVLVVVFYHANVPFFSGGFVGVDVFFVISGYLITTIILSDLNAGNFSIASFYSRRIKRILPALFVVCIVSSFLAVILLNPAQLNEFGNNLLGVATFLSNMVLLFTQGYFEQAVELNPLVHMWTLSVEEQYYIIMPLLLMVLFYFKFNQSLLLVVVFLTILSLLISIFFTDISDSSFLSSLSFYSIFSRAWELLVGSLIAIIFIDKGRLEIKQPFNDIFIFSGLLMILSPVLFYNSQTAFPGFHSIPVIAGTAILIIFLNKNSIFFKAFSSRLVVGLGLISYSLYLWHQPLLSFVRIYYSEFSSLPFLVSLAIIFISIIFSYLSWKFIENPLRRSKRTNTAIILIGLSSLVCLFFLGLFLKSISSGYEREMANQLDKNDFIYFQNMDEREFVFERVRLHDEVDTVIVGSSRLMQLDLSSTNKNSLNLSVSGAFLHDIFSISVASIKTLSPKELIIGIDPWIVNKFAGLPSPLFSDLDRINFWNEKALQELEIGEADTTTYTEPDRSPNHLFDFYKKINIHKGSFTSKNGNHENIDKKSYQGLHIYSTQEENKRFIENKEFSIKSILNYGYMNQYEFSQSHLNNLNQLLEFAKLYNVEVSFFFSPYMPSVYKEFLYIDSDIIEVEKKLMEFAENNDIKVLGSYDPNKYGCDWQYFYDGMHPVKECLDIIMDSTHHNSN